MVDAEPIAHVELEATFRSPIEAECEERMPLGFIVFGMLAFVVQVLWLAQIGWWLLNLF